MTETTGSSSNGKSFGLLVNPDAEVILPVLETDPVWASYGFCDLEPEFRPMCDWYVVSADGNSKACLLLFKDPELSEIHPFGEPEGVAFLAGKIDLPPTIYAHIHLDHVSVIRPLYDWKSLRPFDRMYVTPDDFKPYTMEAERLGPEHMREVVSFYEEHPGSFFLPEMLETGPYFAVRQGGRIVSIAGVHLVSNTYGLANFGNLSTDKAHRRKGYGAACSGAVVRDLLTTGFRHVFLNVESKNVPAIRLYEGLGFRMHCTYLEGIGERKQVGCKG